MIQRDFMLRMIEQIGSLVGRVLNRDISHENVGMELDAIAAEWIGLPSSILLGLPAEEVIRLFEDSNRMVAEKCYLMAEVCRAMGLIADDVARRDEFLAQARVFYGRSSGAGWSDELKSRIDGRMVELKNVPW